MERHITELVSRHKYTAVFSISVLTYTTVFGIKPNPSLAKVRACLYDPARAGRIAFISRRRETRFAWILSLYETLPG